MEKFKINILQSFLDDLVKIKNEKLRNRAIQRAINDGNFIAQGEDHPVNTKYKLFSRYINKSGDNLCRLIFFREGSTVFFWRLMTDHNAYERLVNNDKSVETAYKIEIPEVSVDSSTQVTTNVEMFEAISSLIEESFLNCSG